jgi:tetratricopeptide (TPR) repeat protein/two-component sensor histidine kinase
MNKMTLTKVLLLLVLPFSTTVVVAQTSVGKWRKLLPSLTDTSLVNAFNHLSDAYVYYNTDSSLFFAGRAISTSDAIQYPRGKAIGCLHLAANELLVGTVPAMERYSAQAVSLLEHDQTAQGKSQLVRALMVLAVSYWGQGRFDEAIRCYKKAEQRCVRVGERKILADIYGVMAALETQRGQYKSSLAYCIKGIPLWRKPASFSCNGFSALASLYNSVGDHQTALAYCRESNKMIGAETEPAARFRFFMGETYFQTGQFDSALLCYQYKARPKQKLRSLVPATPWCREQIWSMSRTGEVYAARGQYDSAIPLLTKSLRYFEAVTDVNQIMWTLLRLANACVGNNHDAEAQRYAHRLRGYASRFGARQYLRDAHFVLYNLFEHHHQPDSAYQHLLQYTRLKTIIDADQAQQRLAFFKSELETEKSNASIAKLTKEQQVQHLRLEQYLLQKYFLLTLLALLLAFSGILLRNIALKQQSEKNRRELTENELRLQRFEHARVKAELQQQATALEMQALRSQMNPHFIFNSLNSINRFILQSSRERASEYLVKFAKLMRCILQNSEQTLITLEQEVDTLTLYLQLEALRFNNRFTFNITAQQDMDISALKVPPLIIQPYAENAIWHGLMHKEENGHLDIDIREQTDALIITVTDDGIGRKKAAATSTKDSKRRSFGSKITADRVAMLRRLYGHDAAVTINDLVSAEGEAMGTEVIITVPINCG